MAVLTTEFGLSPADVPPIVIDYPPNRTLGDLALPIAFELARRLRKAPRAIAQELAAAIGPVEGLSRVESTANGYLNCFLDRPAFLRARLAKDAVAATQSGEGKIIVEHTNINPNKAAHIGHIRNAVLGDTFARVLRFRGVPVEVQNYIDDTGVQVADVVVGFQHLEKKTLDEVQAIAAQPRFDYYCWDFYARVRVVRRGQGASEVRQRALQHIEEGDNETAELARLIRIGSSTATWRRCSGWKSSTTCCPRKATSCT